MSYDERWPIYVRDARSRSVGARNRWWMQLTTGLFVLCGER
jgi:hypothetical protein